MATKKTPAKKTPAKKAPAAKAKAPAKKAPAKKAPAKKAPAAKAPAKKAPAKKAPAAKAKAPAKKAPAAKAKAPAAKAPTAKAPAGKGSGRGMPQAGSGLSRTTTPTRKASAKPYEGAFVESQRERLVAERAEHLEQAAHLRAEADSLVRNRELGDTQFDDEGGEGDTIAVERDFDLHLARQSLATVEEIDAALDRIERNVYGICEVSGQRIPKERLQAIPWARERVEFRGSRLR